MSHLNLVSIWVFKFKNFAQRECIINSKKNKDQSENNIDIKNLYVLIRQQIIMV